MCLAPPHTKAVCPFMRMTLTPSCWSIKNISTGSFRNSAAVAYSPSMGLLFFLSPHITQTLHTVDRLCLTVWECLAKARMRWPMFCTVALNKEICGKVCPSSVRFSLNMNMRLSLKELNFSSQSEVKIYLTNLIFDLMSFGFLSY